MGNNKGKASAAIQKVSVDLKAAGKNILSSRAGASAEEIRVKLAKLRCEQTSKRGKAFRNKIQMVTPEQAGGMCR